MPPAGFVPFRWKRVAGFNGVYRGSKEVKSLSSVCPYCGQSSTGYWGGVEQHGIQVEAGRLISWKQLDRDAALRRRYGVGWDPHRPVGFRCRAWETFTCTSHRCRNRKVWLDEKLGGMDEGIAYAKASAMNPKYFTAMETDELGRAIIK